MADAQADRRQSSVRRPTIGDTTTDHSEDRRAIERIIEDVETGFNTNDAELAVAHFAGDGTAVNVAGTRLIGIDALLDAHLQGFSGPLQNEYASYEVEDIVFVRPDVAIAHKRAWPTSRDGERLEQGHAMVAQYVLVKEGDQWWIAARQNTAVPH